MTRSVLPIFSGGTGRSGTTVVGKLLAQHSEIRGGKPYEIRFVNDRFGLLDLCFGVEEFEPSWKRLASSTYISVISPKKRTLFFGAFERRIRGKWWERKNRIENSSGLFRSITIEEREELIAIFRKEFPLDHLNASRNFLFNYLERQKHNKLEPYWIDTTPLNISVADRIHHVFPEAKFIHMKRDGRDTVASALKENWGPKDPSKALKWWERRMEISQHALSFIPRSQVLEMDLEALVVTDRDASYERLLDFIGVGDSPKMRKYFDEEMPSSRLRIGKYRDEITEWKKLDQEYEKVLARLKN
jgi:hypothetical protein